MFAKRPLGTSKGRLVWREPLVWAAADTFDLVPGAALPLALYRERSVSREAALAALNDSELTWEILDTSPSLTGVRAAALAGPALWPRYFSVTVDAFQSPLAGEVPYHRKISWREAGGQPLPTTWCDFEQRHPVFRLRIYRQRERQAFGD